MLSGSNRTAQGAPAASAERPDYAPIESYGLVGDGRSCALIDADGSLDWLCWPDFHSPAIFCALLDRRKGGRFRIGPALPPERVSRRYLPGTAILETIFKSHDGSIRLLDFMPVRDGGRIAPLREIVRIVEVLEGKPELAVVFAPRPNYATHPVRIRLRDGVGHSCELKAGALHLLTDFPLTNADDATLTGCGRLEKGERRVFSLSYAGGEPAVLMAPREVESTLEETEAFWHEWSGQCRYEGPYREAVLRSAVTLKLLTFAPSGALIAAATTSLPEAIGEDLNWDYRYCWLRDASLVLRAFSDLGFDREAARFIGWLLHTTRLSAPELYPLYDVTGRHDVHETILDHLEGYRGSRPVRIGNAAHGQLQLDVYGAVVLAAYDYVDRGGALDSAAKRYLSGFADIVMRRWHEPDNGIWEVRSARRRHTHSALMCWAALDRLARLHDGGILRIDRDRVERTLGEIRHAIETQGWDDHLGAYSGTFGSATLDSALLVMARTHFHAADDPRLVRTHASLRNALGSGPLLRRYGGRFDTPAHEEATFVICAFWEIEYLARRGDLEAAERQLAAMLDHASELLLFGEEIEVATGSMLGNFPQAFTHAGLIDAALWIERARAAEGGPVTGPVRKRRFAT